MKKYFIITLGCQINKSDSERIASKLNELKYKSASQIGEADLIVANMCSVRQSAVDRIYGLYPKFKKLKSCNKQLKTLLTGCILKHDIKNFEKFFDYILPIKTLPYWNQAFEKSNLTYYPNQRNKGLNKKFKIDYFKIKPCYKNNFSCYIPIVVGCNNFCSYCVVPHTRGPETSRSAENVLKEIKNAVKNGAKQIWLLGENVNNYLSTSPTSKKAKVTKIDLLELLKRANNIKGDFWISFTSCYPANFSQGLVSAIAENDKISEYISLPIQSGDNKILKKMNRFYTVEDYEKLIYKVRKSLPSATISTDIIVGFPGETKKQFENTARFLRNIKSDMAYIAEYSPRPGTSAFKMKDNVSGKEKKKRREILTKILEKTALENNKKYIGKSVKVLIQDIIKNRFVVGKTQRFKTVKIEIKRPRFNLGDLVGKIIEVKIVDALSWGLKGEYEPQSKL